MITRPFSNNWFPTMRFSQVLISINITNIFSNVGKLANIYVFFYFLLVSKIIKTHLFFTNLHTNVSFSAKLHPNLP